MNQVKSIKLELKDFDLKKRTATIAHAVYNNVDRTGDISRKGMFNRGWNNSKDEIAFFFNHDKNQVPGKVLNVYEDDQKAYTHVKFGTHTLGNDVLIMADEQILKSASFGFYVVKANQIEVKGQKVRELKEVFHLESSILSVMPANPLAGVIEVNKSLQTQLIELEKFCRNSKASDECIKSILTQVEDINRVLEHSQYPDTPIIPDEERPIVNSAKIIELHQSIKLINAQF
jgi:HK97 family phage prohead protease